MVSICNAYRFIVSFSGLNCGSVTSQDSSVTQKPPKFDSTQLRMVARNTSCRNLQRGAELASEKVEMTVTAEVPVLELAEEDSASKVLMALSMRLICWPIRLWRSASTVRLRVLSSLLISRWMGGHFSFRFSFSRKSPSSGELMVMPQLAVLIMMLNRSSGITFSFSHDSRSRSKQRWISLCSRISLLKPSSLSVIYPSKVMSTWLLRSRASLTTETKVSPSWRSTMNLMQTQPMASSPLAHLIGSLSSLCMTLEGTISLSDSLSKSSRQLSRTLCTSLQPSGMIEFSSIPIRSCRFIPRILHSPLLTASIISLQHVIEFNSMNVCEVLRCRSARSPSLGWSMKLLSSLRTRVLIANVSDALFSNTYTSSSSFAVFLMMSSAYSLKLVVESIYMAQSAVVSKRKRLRSYPFTTRLQKTLSSCIRRTTSPPSSCIRATRGPYRLTSPQNCSFSFRMALISCATRWQCWSYSRAYSYCSSYRLELLASRSYRSTLARARSRPTNPQKSVGCHWERKLRALMACSLRRRKSTQFWKRRGSGAVLKRQRAFSQSCRSRYCFFWLCSSLWQKQCELRHFREWNRMRVCSSIGSAASSSSSRRQCAISREQQILSGSACRSTSTRRTISERATEPAATTRTSYNYSPRTRAKLAEKIESEQCTQMAAIPVKYSTFQPMLPKMRTRQVSTQIRSEKAARKYCWACPEKAPSPIASRKMYNFHFSLQASSAPASIGTETQGATCRNGAIVNSMLKSHTSATVTPSRNSSGPRNPLALDGWQWKQRNPRKQMRGGSVPSFRRKERTLRLSRTIRREHC